MKKLLFVASLAFLLTGTSFADTGKKKKSAKGKSCCSHDKKACNKQADSKTVNL